MTDASNPAGYTEQAEPELDHIRDTFPDPIVTESSRQSRRTVAGNSAVTTGDQRSRPGTPRRNSASSTRNPKTGLHPLNQDRTRASAQSRPADRHQRRYPPSRRR